MAWVVPIVESVAAWLGPFWAKVALTVIEAAAAFGLSRLVAPRPGTLTAGSPLTLSRSPVDPRRVIYGRTRVSGTLVFATTWGDNDKYLDMAIAMAGHECDAIEAIYFNDDIVPTDGDGNATGTYAGYAYIKSHLGADDQLVDPTLAAHVPWDSDHRLRGIAYLAMHLTWDQGKFPAGMPNPTAVIRGRKVFDPRTQTTVWSDNPALAIRDYLTDTRIGMAVAADELDDNSFIAAANICDELITLPDTTTEKRYTCNGCFDLSADPCTILDQLCASMAGWVTYVGGRWICQAGAYIEPTITLDEDDLRASIEMQTKASMRDTCNGVKGTFASPSDHWQDEDFPEVQDGEAVDDDGVPIWKDLDLGFTTSAYTAQRLATIVLKRTRQDLVITMPCKLTALRARAGETVMVKNTRFGWVEKVFLVQELKFTPYDESGEPALGVDLTLCATAPNVYEGAQQKVCQTGQVQLATCVGEDFTPVLQGDLPTPGTFAESIGLTPSIPNGAPQFNPLGGTASLAGLPAFTSPSSPPDLYLSCAWMGTTEWKIWSTPGGNCAGDPASICTDTLSGEWNKDPVTLAETNTGTDTRDSGCDPSGASGIAPGYVDNHETMSVTLSPTVATCVPSNVGQCVDTEFGTEMATGSHITTLSNPDTEQQAIARLRAGGYSGWSGMAQEAYYQQRTTGTSWAYQEFKFKQVWSDASPDWPYSIQVQYEGCDFESSDWADENQDEFILNADEDGTLTLPEQLVVADIGRRKRIKTISVDSA